MSLLVEIKKQLGNFHLDVSFTSHNNVLSLLGASGCGKSMTLKCIAGICRPDSGRIVLNDTVLFDSERNIDLPPQKRMIGYLFQQYALFPNMTVEQNIVAGIRDKKHAKFAVSDMIHRMRLDGLEKLRPHQLSGGQQQRTALARILVNEPEVLLLDEPLSALDHHLRFQMEEEIRTLIRTFQKPIVLVSHNQEEVYRLSNQVALMTNGRIESTGDKETIFTQPKTRNGAVLTGFQNISSVQRLSENQVFAPEWGISLAVPHTDCDFIAIRAQQIASGEDENSILCHVADEIENPFSVSVVLYPNQQAKSPIIWELDKAQWAQIRAQKIQICLPKAHIQCLKE